ncbi:GNAT family N-acetyltransferase [Siccirubricoccus sp. G192]|uniref:GNAT family N-acetyltransferase n=1 Tax=Siccirubricoccus sp. G192 TaxID=2849651 RepID=UPI0035C85381
MPDTQTGLILRDSRAEDIPALTRIYAHWVRHGLASFELEPPDAAEMARRREAVLAGGYPHLVATDTAGEVLGYAYASAYRSRPAYRFAVENSRLCGAGGGAPGHRPGTAAGAGRALHRGGVPADGGGDRR